MQEIVGAHFEIYMKYPNVCITLDKMEYSTDIINLRPHESTLDTIKQNKFQ